MQLIKAKVPFRWTCPVCGRNSVITEASVKKTHGTMVTGCSKSDEMVTLEGVLIICPDVECAAPFVRIGAHWSAFGRNGLVPDYNRPIGIGCYTFLPIVSKPLSETVPKHIQNDFNEAHLILQFSPKASATLARRALQGMIRHRWGVTEKTLHQELVAIQEHCDEELYQAMMGLKAIGNIGAHPEKDVAVIIDVEDGEADELLKLLLILDEEWFIARARRNKNLASVTALAAAKKAEQSNAKN